MSIKQMEEDSVPGDPFSDDDNQEETSTDFSENEQLGSFEEPEEDVAEDDFSEEEGSDSELVEMIKSSDKVVEPKDLQDLDMSDEELRKALGEINPEELDGGFESLEDDISDTLENSIEKTLRSGGVHQFENLKERIDRLREDLNADSGHEVNELKAKVDDLQGSLEEVDGLKAEVGDLQDSLEMISDYIIDTAGEGNLQDSLESTSSDEVEELRSEIDEIRDDLANLSDFVVEMSN